MKQMHPFNSLRTVRGLLWLLAFGSSLNAGLKTAAPITSPTTVTSQQKTLPTIAEIVTEGNRYVTSAAILSRVPYRIGGLFDAEFAPQTIQNIYGLGYFNQVQLATVDLGNNKVKLLVQVAERKLVEQVVFEGNKAIKRKKFIEKLHIEKLETIDDERISRLAQEIRKLYREQNYHHALVTTEVVPNEKNPEKVTAVFRIDEGAKSTIRRVHFDGVHAIPDRRLRTIIYTREQWVGSAFDEAGKYNQEMLDMDKKRIEFFYQDNGFLMARVTGADIEYLKNGGQMDISFSIKEGKQFTIRSIGIDCGEDFKEADLLKKIDLEEGQIYSRSRIVNAINVLKDAWGELGYIEADVYPQIKPNEPTGEVDITFFVERGEKMFVNRINITGNTVTHDKVIRRQIKLQEGDLITARKLSDSRRNVEFLSFFERGAVNWRIHKIAPNKADLEMHVKETLTGHLNFNMAYGSDEGSVARNVRFGVDCNKANFMGQGWDIGGMVQTRASSFHKAEIRFFDPYFFDHNIAAGFNGYVRREQYDQWQNVSAVPVEKTKGITGQFGFPLPDADDRLQLLANFGIESIRYNQRITAIGLGANRVFFQPIIDAKFQPGDLYTVGLALVKDTRNHRVYPNEGYRFEINTQAAPPGINREFSYIKGEIEASWYTALIGRDSLVLSLHGKAGIINKIDSSKIVPYKELFHMGGQGTVRGFVWGGVGPAWGPNNTPLGARKAIQFNAELIFPLAPDYSMKGHVFYDAGSGWDTPKDFITHRSFLRRDDFNVRHAVGFGLNLMQPFPAKIDWGYKLDRDKKAGESPHEFHISMNYAW